MTFNGESITLENAYMVSTIVSGFPLWSIDAGSGDGNGLLGFAQLFRELQAETYVFNTTAGGARAGLFSIGSGSDMVVYLTDEAHVGTVVIDSVTEERVKGHFTATFVGYDVNSEARLAELVCDGFDLPLLDERPE